jgi:hypothetical protein
MSRTLHPRRSNQVDADNLAFYQEQIKRSLAKAYASLEQWRGYEKEYLQLKEGIKTLPEETSHAVMASIMYRGAVKYCITYLHLDTHWTYGILSWKNRQNKSISSFIR